VNGKPGAVQETATHGQLYPFSIFGKTKLDFNGNSGVGFATYDPTQPAGPNNPNSSGGVSVGSNGTITCNVQGLGQNVAVDYYGSGGVGGCAGGPPPNGCSAGNQYCNTYYLAPVTPPASGSCLNNGSWGSGIAGAPTVLPAGTYVCNGTVTISGTLTVNGPVTVYITGTAATALDIVAGSYVNDPVPNLPTSKNLQILTNSSGQFGDSNGQAFYLGAIVYAPNATMTGDACKSVFYGALVINQDTCNGSPHLTINYDNSLSGLYGPWTASNYAVINPQGVHIP
jgi:hypothetical protein